MALFGMSCAVKSQNKWLKTWITYEAIVKFIMCKNPHGLTDKDKNMITKEVCFR